jgi:hypothetical protein
MIRDDVNQFVSRINLATNRRIDEQQAELLYRDMLNLDITDTEFRRVSVMYLDEEDIPRNIIKYFRDHIRRAQMMANPATLPQQDSVTGEYTAEQAGGFCECVRLALRGYHKHQDHYNQWAAWFNQKWAALVGQQLDAFLAGEMARLSGKPKQEVAA